MPLNNDSCFVFPGLTTKFHGCGAISPALAVVFVLYLFAVDVLCKYFCNMPFLIKIFFCVGMPSKSNFVAPMPFWYKGSSIKVKVLLAICFFSLFARKLNPASTEKIEQAFPISPIKPDSGSGSKKIGRAHV